MYIWIKLREVNNFVKKIGLVVTALTPLPPKKHVLFKYRLDGRLKSLEEKLCSKLIIWICFNITWIWFYDMSSDFSWNNQRQFLIHIIMDSMFWQPPLSFFLILKNTGSFILNQFHNCSLFHICFSLMDNEISMWRSQGMPCCLWSWAILVSENKLSAHTRQSLVSFETAAGL